MTRDSDMPDESNRYDGAPAPPKPSPERPSRKEIRNAHRDALAKAGCSRCDEDHPDNLDFYYPLTPSCRAMQKRPDSFALCDDCAAERAPDYATKMLEEARKGDADLAVVYACGVVSRHTIDRQTDSDGRPLPGIPNASIAARHRCGENIERVEFFE